ncbi:MAG: nucleotidyltransferase family protein [Acidimicrobiales bacterium]
MQFVTGVVLAAGGSRRLGEPKQLLGYKDSTLLGSTLAMARSCGFQQLIVTLGAGSSHVRESVDLTGFEIVENHEYAAGCSSSIAAALGVVDPRSTGLVLLLGDQPEVSPLAVTALVAGCRASRLGVCRYDDGRGHPFWFSRDVFGELAALHGDKAVWKVLESGRYEVVEVTQAGPVPLDVDTWDDYEALLAQARGTS